jgi:hypothetical protein
LLERVEEPNPEVSGPGLHTTKEKE